MKRNLFYMFIIVFIAFLSFGVFIGCSSDDDSSWAENCDCSADIYNCSSFDSKEEAEACFYNCLGDYGDIHRLDSDNDNEPCESLK